MTLTDKQKSWTERKAENRLARFVTRAVPVAARPPRPRSVTGPCRDCPHGWKHHTQSSRCRPGCACTKGADRKERR